MWKIIPEIRRSTAKCPGSYRARVKLKDHGAIPARNIILCGPWEHRIVLKINLCSFISEIMKSAQVTQVSVSIWHSIYMQKWTMDNKCKCKWTLLCIWYAVVRIKGVGFFGWWRLRGSCILKGIKRTSSSAPPTEKHDILHSGIKKSIVAGLRWFLWSYCNGKCPERISLCESASETTTSFFLLLQALIAYHMHAKYIKVQGFFICHIINVETCVLYARQSQFLHINCMLNRNRAIDINFHKPVLICFFKSVTRS